MKSRSLWVFGMAALFTACNSDGVAGPGGGGGALPQFSQQITLPEFEDAMVSGPNRVEIKLLNGTLVAREVEVKESEELFDEEEIESRISSIDPAGSVTLSLGGGFTVAFNAGTDFEAEDGQRISMQDFITRVQDALAVGRNPGVEVKRNPAAAPQDPSDATFIASELELDDEADDQKMELNVDGDNFAFNASPPPDAILTVLGLAVELNVSGGVTELESEIDDNNSERDFEGIVASVNGSSFTLTDGTVIEIVAGTEVDDADDSDELGSLGEVATALASGLIVEAEGEGDVTGTNPLTITAKEVEFEVEDEDDNLPGALEFQDRVASVDVAGRTLTLANGTVVQVATDQVVDPLGDLLSLQATDAAVQAQRLVRAEGHAELVSAGPPMVLNALDIKIEDDS
ncbi:MAG TPA: DUF5666 domain-containing protein [Gemmatimonadales bacterium]|nr:DUF5666 domain-containing protein [Gemmatimonadales bacterium]